MFQILSHILYSYLLVHTIECIESSVSTHVCDMLSVLPLLLIEFPALLSKTKAGKNTTTTTFANLEIDYYEYFFQQTSQSRFIYVCAAVSVFPPKNTVVTKNLPSSVAVMLLLLWSGDAG